MSLPDFAGLIITATVRMMLFLAWGAASRPNLGRLSHTKFQSSIIKKRFLQLIDWPSTCIHFDCIDHPRDLIGVLTKKTFCLCITRAISIFQWKLKPEISRKPSSCVRSSLTHFDQVGSTNRVSPRHGSIRHLTWWWSRMLPGRSGSFYRFGNFILIVFSKVA